MAHTASVWVCCRCRLFCSSQHRQCRHRLHYSSLSSSSNSSSKSQPRHRCSNISCSSWRLRSSSNSKCKNSKKFRRSRCSCSSCNSNHTRTSTSSSRVTCSGSRRHHRRRSNKCCPRAAALHPLTARDPMNRCRIDRSALLFSTARPQWHRTDNRRSDRRSPGVYNGPPLPCVRHSSESARRSDNNSRSRSRNRSRR